MLLVLVGVGVHHLVQTRHSILRNHPVLGHVRFLLESIRPELQQYVIERNVDGRPGGGDLFEHLGSGELLADPPRAWAADGERADPDRFR